MRKSSAGRRSSSNPVRISMLDRDEKNGTRPDGKRTQQSGKSKGQTHAENSQIPKPRVRSSSSERGSIRPSNLKVPGTSGAGPLRQQYSSIGAGFATPLGAQATPRVSTNHVHTDLPSGARHRSPSAERASGFTAKGPRKDVRALNDKAYQGWMLNKIDTFFYEIQQTTILNANGSLKPVGLKMFVEATGCLLKLLGAKVELTVANYVEELPKIANKLHYPGVMTKSWLKTANAIHSWPQVLGWLSWLVEFCEAKDLASMSFEIEKIPFISANGEDETFKNTFLAMFKFYAAWNAGNVKEEAALIQEHIEKMNASDGDIDEAIARTEKEIESLMKGDRTMDDKSSELDKEIRRLRESLKLAKLEDEKETVELEAKEQVGRKTEREIEQLNSNIEALEDEIQQHKKRETELQIYIENQPMPVQKRDDITKQCSELQSYIHQFESHIGDIENEIYAMDMKFAGVNRKVCTAILAYNKDIILNLGSNQDGPDVAELKLPESNMLDTDFMTILAERVSAMKTFKETVLSQISRSESIIEANTNELDALNEKLETMRQEKKEHVARMHEEKLSIQKIEHHAAEKKAKLRRQIKNLECDIVNLQRSMPDLESDETELAEAKDKLEAVIRRKDFLADQAELLFNKLYEITAHHRSELGRVLDDFPSFKTEHTQSQPTSDP